VAPFGSSGMTSYASSIVTVAITCTVCENCRVTLKIGVWITQVPPFNSLGMVSYLTSIAAMDVSRTVSKIGLRERLGLDDIISVVQQSRLRWYGHVLRKEDNDWVKKCME